MEEQWYSRTASALSLGLGFLALLLASLGIYGVISYSIGLRTHEIGIRMALGATSGAVLRLVIGQGMYLVVIGAVIGAVGSMMISKMLSILLFGIDRFDPLAYLSASLFLVAIALFAMYLPARRATKIEPLTSLRAR